MSVRIRVESSHKPMLLPFGVGKDPAKGLPSTVVREVFSYLNGKDLCGLCRKTNKEWRALASESRLSTRVMANTYAFGKEKWAKYFGDIGLEPPLPRNIEEILK